MNIEQEIIDRIINFNPIREGLTGQSNFGKIHGAELVFDCYSYPRRLTIPPRSLTGELTTQPVLALVRRANNGKTQVTTLAYEEDAINLGEDLALLVDSQLTAAKMRRLWCVIEGGRREEVLNAG